MTPEERAAYMKEYYRQHKAHLRIYKHNWYLKNRDRIMERRRKAATK